MKFLTLFAVILAMTANTVYGESLSFECKCSKKCNGFKNARIERVSLTSKQATISLGDKEWEMNDKFETEFESILNKSFQKYKITGGGGGFEIDTKKSSFELENSIIKGNDGKLIFSLKNEQAVAKVIFKCKKL